MLKKDRVSTIATPARRRKAETTGSDRLQNIVRRLLVEKFQTEPLDVSIRPDLGSDDDPILRIMITLDSPIDEKFVSFLRHLRDRMHHEGVEEFPVISFVSKSDADDRRLEAV